jgi:phage terminase small subunit
MAGRRATPSNLLEMGNNVARKTKKDIEDRQAMSVDLGSFSIEIPTTLRGHQKAMKRFKEIIELYNDGGLMLVTSADIDILVEYCLVFERVRDTHLILDSYKTTKERLADQDEYIKWLNALDKLTSKMIKLSEYLYLNPTARARTGGKLPTKKEESPLEQKGFGDL